MEPIAPPINPGTVTSQETILLWCKFIISSLVGVTTGYELDVRGSIPSRARDLPLLLRVNSGSAVYPASYLTGTGSSFPGGK
jgi:hypothetical protein